jgi:DtxR family Mn-dependent transcriptional regulator
MLTVSKEDYLKAIAEAEADGQPVIGARLAHWLSVTPPAVTFAVKRLTKDGLVTFGKNSEIRLAPEGRKIAEATIVRHHLIERMLFEIFDMPWYQVHEEAERLEHAVSPMFEKKLLEKLGHKDTCPHGNGLSLRSPADRRKKGMSLLSEAEPNTEYTIASVYERDGKLLEFLDGHGLRPGARVKIETRNYDGTLSLLVDKHPVHLGGVVAEKVWLSKSEPKQKQSR